MFFPLLQAQNSLCYFSCHFPLPLLLSEPSLMLSSLGRPATLLWLPASSMISQCSHWSFPWGQPPPFPWMILLSCTNISRSPVPSPVVGDHRDGAQEPSQIRQRAGPTATERSNTHVQHVKKNDFWTWKLKPFPFDFAFYLQAHEHVCLNLHLFRRSTISTSRSTSSVRQLFTGQLAVWPAVSLNWACFSPVTFLKRQLI